MRASLCFTLGLLLLPLLVACNNSPAPPKVRLAINPWPGYEFLFLASQKRLFEAQGLDIELIELASLSDVQRVFIQDRANAMASSMIEGVQVAGTNQQALALILIPDYSFGGDVIIAASAKSISELRGQRIGVELDSLGLFILAQALEIEGIELSEVSLINVNQLEAVAAFKNKRVDAIVTYPPFSNELLRLGTTTRIFDTSQIPGQVIDTVFIDPVILEADPQWTQKFHQAWGQALQYSRENQVEAYTLMADREGISYTEFQQALTGLKIVEASEQASALRSPSVQENISKVCATLATVDAINFSCENMTQLIQPHF